MAKRTQEQLLADIAKPEVFELLKRVCNRKLEQLGSEYPDRETQTWAVQLEEAKAYLSDNTSPTPFINAAITGTETVQDYAELIVANNAAWSNFAGSIVKLRRDFEKAIEACTTLEELKAVELQLKGV